MKINSTNKTVLFLSDIHHDIDKANKIIKAIGPDITVFLGDIFDSHYYDTDRDFIRSAKWYLDFISKPGNYATLGNHDSYLLHFNNHWLCSGFTMDKRELARELELFKNYERYFRFHIFVDDILCTHAGLNENFVPVFPEDWDEWLEKETELAKLPLISNNPHWFWGAGKARGGSQEVGGLTWCDAKQEFRGVPGLKQLFGHTNHHRIYVPPYTQETGKIDQNKDYRLDSDNLCIDCSLNEVLIIQNQKKRIVRHEDL